MSSSAAPLENNAVADGILPAQKVYVKNAPGKGKGVFARDCIRKDEIIEHSPVLLLSADQEELLSESGIPIKDYIFAWSDEDHSRSAAVGFGFLSLMNHSDRPNVYLSTDQERQVMIVRAERDIQPHEELCFDYGVELWFEAV